MKINSELYHFDTENKQQRRMLSTRIFTQIADPYYKAWLKFRETNHFKIIIKTNRKKMRYPCIKSNNKYEYCSCTFLIFSVQNELFTENRKKLHHGESTSYIFRSTEGILVSKYAKKCCSILERTLLYLKCFF